MNPKKILRIIVAQRTIFLIILFGVLVGAGAMLSIRPKVYEAKVRVMIDLAKDPITGAAIDPRAFPVIVATQSQLIMDPTVIAGAARKLGYMSANPPSANDAAGRAQESQFITSFSRSVLATQVPDSNLIDISAFANSVPEARRIAEAVRATYIQLSIEQQRASARGALKIIQQQLGDYLNRRTQASERRVAFERKYNVVLADSGYDADELALHRIVSADQDQLIRMAQRRIYGANTSARAVARIDSQLATARAALGPNHPAVQALELQRAATVATNFNIASQQSETNIRTVANLMSAQLQESLARRGILAEGNMLLHEERIYDNLLRNLAARVVTTAQTANVVNSGVRAMGGPVGGDKAIAPNYAVTFGFAAFIGLLLGLEAALILEFLNRRVRSVDDLVDLGLPNLAGTARVDNEGRRKPALMPAE